MFIMLILYQWEENLLTQLLLNIDRLLPSGSRPVMQGPTQRQHKIGLFVGLFSKSALL